jgi:transposase
MPYALLCTDCGHVYTTGKDKTTMSVKEYAVYIEDFNGNMYDEYTIEAESESEAYDKAYENIGWKAMEVHVTEIKVETAPSKALQDAYFGGSNPLDSFPTIWRSDKP